MIDKILTSVPDWYDEKPAWAKMLLFVPLIIVLAFVISAIAARSIIQPSVRSSATKRREAQKRDLDEERERTEAMIEEMEREIAKIEAKRALVEEETKDAHEAIDAADSFSGVDRARDSQR